jgi:hypothetical protein
MTLDHITIPVPPSEQKKIVSFYLTALKPLGYTTIISYGPNDGVVGIGANGKPDYWITATPGAASTLDLHIAFRTSGRLTS